MLKGVIFDMDGVLVDSEEYIREAAMRMFAERGLIVQPEDFIPFIGAGEDRFIGGPAEKYNFPLDLAEDKARTYEIYGDLVKDLQPLTGAREFVRKLKTRGLKLAVASAADKVKVDINLGILSLPSGTFDVVVNGLDVEKKKPDPEMFLLAAKKLGLSNSECLVVEDAVNGVRAAKAAGSKCLGITTSFTPDDLHEADWFAANLAEAPEEATGW